MSISYEKPKLVALVQDVMIRDGMTLPDDVVLFNSDNAHNDYRTLKPEGKKCVAFTSIQTANYLNRMFDDDLTGVYVEYSPNFEGQWFQHRYWSTSIESEFQLNDMCIYLPFGKLHKMADSIRSMFGDKIFIKPDSGAKAFTGFSCTVDEIAFETMALRQTVMMYDYDMCVVSKHHEISETEYRVWIVESEPVTVACYGWTDDIDNTVPQEVMLLAKTVANSEFANHYTPTFVADFCMLNGKPKLIEVNCMATSGWYEGMDIEALLEALDNRDLMMANSGDSI